jgi:hypothetical protein
MIISQLNLRLNLRLLILDAEDDSDPKSKL